MYWYLVVCLFVLRAACDPQFEIFNSGKNNLFREGGTQLKVVFTLYVDIP